MDQDQIRSDHIDFQEVGKHANNHCVILGGGQPRYRNRPNYTNTGNPDREAAAVIGILGEICLLYTSDAADE